MKTEKKNQALVTLIIVVVLAVGAIVFYLSTQSEPESSETATPSTSTSTETTNSSTDTNEATDETSVAVDSDGEYADGSYTATGSYSTPGGSESVTVTVTLADDTITAVSATGSATRGNSAQYQSAFLGAYETQVVGKSVDDVSLSHVAGSSLTSNGFNKALDTIKNDARA